MLMADSGSFAAHGFVSRNHHDPRGVHLDGLDSTISDARTVDLRGSVVELTTKEIPIFWLIWRFVRGTCSLESNSW